MTRTGAAAGSERLAARTAGAASEASPRPGAAGEAEARRFARRRRALLRDTAGLLSESRRVVGCGKAMTHGQVSMVMGVAGAGYAGVAYCGAVWLCASCSAVVRSVRAADVQEAVSGHLAAGGGALFVTLTVPHTARDLLAQTWPVVSDGWRWVQSGRAGRVLRDLIRQVGTVRAAECTHGGHGWHPHLHLLLLTERPVSEDVRAAFAALLHERWALWCERRSWGAPLWGIGVRVDNVWGAQVLSAYVAKVQDDKWQQSANWRIGREMARGDLKRGRHVGRTPFELLGEYTRLVELDADDKRRRTIRRLWREYEAGSKGRSTLRWSAGLKAMLGVTDERTDEQIAADVQSAGAVLVAQFDVPTWGAVCRTPGARERLLEIAEDSAGGGGDRVVRVAYELRQLELRAPGEFWDCSTTDSDGRPVGYGPPWWWRPASVVFDSWLSGIA